MKSNNYIIKVLFIFLTLVGVLQGVDNISLNDLESIKKLTQSGGNKFKNNVPTSESFIKVNEVEEKSVDFQDINKTLIKNSIHKKLFHYSEESEDITLGEEKEEKYFAEDIFTVRNNISAVSLPISKKYKIQNGDEINIWVYGVESKYYSFVVDNNGFITLSSGPLKIVHIEFEKMKKIVEEQINKIHPNSNSIVDVSRSDSVFVSIIGKVNSPGIFTIPSGVTAKDAIAIAGGIRKGGSYRNIEVTKINGEKYNIDIYKLLSGKKNYLNFLENGDQINVKNVGNLITVEEEKLNTNYELKNGETLKDLLEYSTVLNSRIVKSNIILKRYEKEVIKTHKLDINSSFLIQNGDKISFYKISEETSDAFYIYGNVVNPGERGYISDLTLNSLINSETKKNSFSSFFLKNTNFDFGVIKRKNKLLEDELLNFSPKKIIEGKSDVKIFPKDEIYFFNQFDFKESPYIYVDGEVLDKPVKVQFTKNMTLETLFNSVEFLSEEFKDKDGVKCLVDDNITLLEKEKVECMRVPVRVDNNYIKVVRRVSENTEKNIFTLKLSEESDFILNEFDEVVFYNYYKTNPIEYLEIVGEVNLPGQYQVDDDTTFGDVIRLAGGLTKKATKNRVEITRYVINGDRRERRVFLKSFNELLDEEFKLMADDTIKIFNIPYWEETKLVTIEGNVVYPGIYNVGEEEKLYDLIQRAGGFKKNSFVKGMKLKRERNRELQRKRHIESLRKLKQYATLLSLQATEAGETTEDKQRLLLSINNLIEQSEEIEIEGIVPLKVTSLDALQDSRYNVKLENNDEIVIPKISDTVTIVGEVLNPGAQIYIDNFDVSDYLDKTGGVNTKGDENNIYVVFENGEVKKYETGYLDFNLVEIEPGATIVVPPKIDTISNIKLAKDISSIFYQLAITAASLKTVGALW